MGVGGVVTMTEGGIGPRALSASSSFALLSFARASGGAGALGQTADCSWGVSWGRGSHVEVRRLWGVGGVVPMTVGGAWVFLPSPHHVLLLFCLLQGPQKRKGLRIGLLVALGERHGAEVRVFR